MHASSFSHRRVPDDILTTLLPHVQNYRIEPCSDSLYMHNNFVIAKVNFMPAAAGRGQLFLIDLFLDQWS